MKLALAELYDKHVLVLVDKAIGNAAIIYQRFYMLTLIKNLGWTQILEMVLKAPMKPVILFKKIYLLLSILKISVIE